MNVDAVQVYNIEGGVVLRSSESVLDVQTLSPGIYFYSISLMDGTMSRGKFVKR
ncbi:MAG: T9SS type A sorting domain-containing protein [Bacteroidaceae bacterium]|nr:T9SS type A sorting domain-containing protein [Bacteroidaceae bacterium]